MKTKRVITEEFEILSNEELNQVRGGTTYTDEEEKKKESGGGEPSDLPPDNEDPVIEPNIF